MFALFSYSSFLKAYGDASSTPITKEDLQSQIQEKTQQLQDISGKLADAKKVLVQTQDQRLTLQKQMNYYQNTINQLNLSIQEDSVTMQKLNLEVNSLNYDLKDMQSSVIDKKNAVNKLLLEMQKSDADNSNILALFLKNKTLADGILETQSLGNMRSQLKLDIQNLADLSQQYNDKIKEKSDMAVQMEQRQNSMAARKIILTGQKEEQQSVLTQTKNQEAIYQNQYSELKKVQDQIDAEIEMISSVLRKNIDPNLLPAASTDVLLDPVPDGIMSQGYGRTAFAAKTYKSQWHNGVDIAAPVGTEIYAPADGTVIDVGNQDRYCPRAAYGKFVEIKHNNGLTTLYGHMSLQVVSIGEKVTRGQLIGYVGKTGWATGSHTHFTVFASQTLTPARPGYPEGSQKSTCGPMPVGGDLNPLLYASIK